MGRICVLLNGCIVNDSRVIKTITTLSLQNNVDLFYVGGTSEDKNIFNQNVQLFNCYYKKDSLYVNILRNSFFYNEFLFFVAEVLRQNKKYDYILCNDLPTLKPGYLLKLKLGCKLVYDSHEIYTGTINQFFPDDAFFLKSVIFKFLIRLMTVLGDRAEKKLVQHVDFFITTSQSFQKYFIQKFKRDDIKIVMNCPPHSVIRDSYDFRKHFNLAENDFIFIFQGVLNKGRALFELIEAMQFTDDKIKLIILGDGMLKSLLQNEVKMKKLYRKIYFMDRVPSKDLIFYTKGADVGINLQASINISKKLASANKIFEYIHANIPIIASNVPENRMVVEKYNLGYIVENEPLLIAGAIGKMVNTDWTDFKENCKRAMMEFNWENQERVLFEIFQ